MLGLLSDTFDYTDIHKNFRVVDFLRDPSTDRIQFFTDTPELLCQGYGEYEILQLCSSGVTKLTLTGIFSQHNCKKPDLTLVKFEGSEKVERLQTVQPDLFIFSIAEPGQTIKKEACMSGGAPAFYVYEYLLDYGDTLLFKGYIPTELLKNPDKTIAAIKTAKTRIKVMKKQIMSCDD